MNFKVYTAVSGKIYLKTIRKKSCICIEDDFESAFYSMPKITLPVQFGPFQR